MTQPAAINAEIAPPRVARQPRLLVSVRDVAEAKAALSGGADWIDLKEPLTGPLGAVTVETARAVVDHVADRRPISAALGELVDWPSSPARGLLDVPGIAAVKLGLASCADCESWSDRWLSAAREIEKVGKTLVAVVYADWQGTRAPAPDEILALAQQARCQYVLVDTFDKRSGDTLDCLGDAELRGILGSARRASLRTVVAGGITRSKISQLPKNSIDVVAVRGGVCPRDRAGRIEERLVAEFRQALATGWQL
jgi:uncharacterized protein (UPF0264 family)